MAIKQGFFGNENELFVYQENTTNNNMSAGFGINSSGLGSFVMQVSAAAGASPLGSGVNILTADFASGNTTIRPTAGGGNVLFGNIYDTVVSTPPVANTVVNVAANGEMGTVLLQSAGATVDITQLSNGVINFEATGTDVGVVTIAGNSGDATGDTVTISGAGGSNITTTGSGSTLAVAVSGTTNHAVIVGNSTGSLTSINPATATTGFVLTSNGTTSNPSWQAPTGGGGGIVTLNGATGSATGSTVTLASGTNITTVASGSTVTHNLSGMTNHAVLLGNSSGAITSIAPSTATSGFVLTSNGTTSDPTWQAAGGGGGIVILSGNSGSATGSTTAVVGGNNISTSGSGATLTLNVAGTSNHGVQLGNASGSLTSINPATAATGYVLTSNGTTSDPTWQVAPGANIAVPFNYYESAGLSGTGNVNYTLGTSSILTQVVDSGSVIYPGDGVSAPATFTAPATGVYFLQFTARLQGASTSTVVTLLSSITISGVGTYYGQSSLTPFNGSFSDQVTATALVPINSGSTATFSVSINCTGNYGMSGGAQGVTWIQGYRIS